MYVYGCRGVDRVAVFMFCVLHFVTEGSYRTARTAHRTAQCRMFSVVLSRNFQAGRDPVPSGVSIQQQRPPLRLLTNAMVVVVAHTLCQGRP